MTSHLFVLLPTLVTFLCYGTPSAISYELNGGRLGDNIRSFTQSLWEAYTYDLPFLYVPFPGSEQFNLHTHFQMLTPELKTTYQEIKKIGDGERLTLTNREDILYITTYFCRTAINWKDERFVEAVRWLFSPREPIALPEGIENGIALHIRRGGGFCVDTEWVIRAEPAHFPALSYYARCVDYLIAQLDGHHTIFMCTDDPNPKVVAQQLFNELAPETAARVEINFRAQGNFHDRNVLEDFMMLRSAKYLIRPISNLSEYAELLGNHACTVIPTRLRHHCGKPYGIIEEAIFIYKDKPAETIMIV
jgi:hypothetical protein